MLTKIYFFLDKKVKTLRILFEKLGKDEILVSKDNTKLKIFKTARFIFLLRPNT